jgi:hypothetical protein
MRHPLMGRIIAAQWSGEAENNMNKPRYVVEILFILRMERNVTMLRNITHTQTRHEMSGDIFWQRLGTVKIIPRRR